MDHTIIVEVKDLKYLKKFANFFLMLKSLKKLNFKESSRPQKSYTVCVLASPHVDKSAQEQFEYRTYSKTYKIDSANYQLFLLYAKKFGSKKYSTLTIKIEFFCKNEKPKVVRYITNLLGIGYDLEFINTEFLKGLKKKTVVEWALLDIAGEMFLHNDLSKNTLN
jgi:ribosomal protein S10